jgi:branched-chain amino acid transport system permease protein
VYNGFMHFPLAIGMAALFAFLTGLICLRTTGVYFIMITMAFAQMLFYALVSIEPYGGDDGLVIELRSEFPHLPWLNLEENVTLYYVTWTCLLLCLYALNRIVHSRFGMVIEGAKGNDRRMQAMGFHTYHYRLTCYVISGAMCGLAGALLGNFTNFISPEMMDWTRSGELIFMVVLGGAGSWFGPVLGAAAFLALEEVLSGITLYWQLIFGLFLIAVVLFARGGIDGWLARGR